MGGYSNLLPLGILSVIFQLAFWCARVYCCWQPSGPVTWQARRWQRTCVSATPVSTCLCGPGRWAQCVGTDVARSPDRLKNRVPPVWP